MLFLANPMKLSVKNEQLLIDNGEVTKVPLEDIECIAVDNQQINVSTYLLMKFSEYAITFYVTDRCHHPCGVFLPVSRHMSVLNEQINMSLPSKKRLWKQIVMHKIRIRNCKPDNGSVRLLVITEKQYEKMELIIGNLVVEEEHAVFEQLSIF